MTTTAFIKELAAESNKESSNLIKRISKSIALSNGRILARSRRSHRAFAQPHDTTSEQQPDTQPVTVVELAKRFPTLVAKTAVSEAQDKVPLQEDITKQGDPTTHRDDTTAPIQPTTAPSILTATSPDPLTSSTPSQQTLPSAGDRK